MAKRSFNEGTANWPCKRGSTAPARPRYPSFNEGTANWPCKPALSSQSRSRVAPLQ